MMISTTKLSPLRKDDLQGKNEESSDEACALFGYVSKMNLQSIMVEV